MEMEWNGNRLSSPHIPEAEHQGVDPERPLRVLNLVPRLPQSALLENHRLPTIIGSRRRRPLLFQFPRFSDPTQSWIRSRGAPIPLFFKVSIQNLEYVSNQCPRFRILGMDSLNSEEDEKRFPKLVGKWKELQQLEIESKPSSFPELAAEIGVNCRKFRGLSMTGSITEEDAVAIVTHLPKIQNLNLSRSYLPKIQLLAIMDGCKDLETLGANYCIGFGPNDEEVVGRTSCRLKFESKGSKAMEDLSFGITGLTEFFVDFF